MQSSETNENNANSAASSDSDSSENLMDDGKKGIRQMFSTEEDAKLVELVKEFGDKNWRVISKHMPNRTTRQCRERYRNYLSPKVTNGPWTAEEDLLLEQKYIEFGPKWATIAQYFKSRSDVNIKNRWASNRHKATRNAPRGLLESLFIPKKQFFNTLQALLIPSLTGGNGSAKKMANGSAVMQSCIQQSLQRMQALKNIGYTNSKNNNNNINILNAINNINNIANSANLAFIANNNNNTNTNIINVNKNSADNSNNNNSSGGYNNEVGNEDDANSYNNIFNMIEGTCTVGSIADMGDETGLPLFVPPSSSDDDIMLTVENSTPVAGGLFAPVGGFEMGQPPFPEFESFF